MQTAEPFGLNSNYAAPDQLAAEARVPAGVDILVDVTDFAHADALKAQALRCRRLASSVSDPQTVKSLMLMAADYEDKARSLTRS